MAYRKAIDIGGSSASVKKNTYPRSKGKSGVAGTFCEEPTPRYIKAKNEEVLTGGNGEYIIMGRDRAKSRIDGYGGRGETKCAAIDLIVGLSSADNPPAVDKNGEQVYVDKNFLSDAARIYLSQKTDIDKNFNLVEGKVGSPEAKSGIGMSADSIRLAGKEGIKLITRNHVINSQGGTVEKVSGIDLIAGNDDRDLQPLVKGRNLAEAITQLTNHVGKLASIITNILINQMQLNTAIATHSHAGVTTAGMGVKVGPSITLMPIAGKCATQHAMNGQTPLTIFRTKQLENFKVNYLTPMGRKYINSYYNNVN